MRNASFLILGGDARQLYLADCLCANHYNVKLYGFTDDNRKNVINTEKELETALRESTVKVFPLPISRDGDNLNAPLSDKKTPLAPLLCELKKNDIVFGGMIPGEIRTSLLRRGIYCGDYYESEYLQTLNAVPTAEGIIKILIEALPITLHGMSCAITGFGKTAKAAASALYALGAKITVFARNEVSIAQARCMGFEAHGTDSLSSEPQSFDALINTVPAMLLGEKQLDNLDTDTLIIEIASAPFGINFDAAHKRGIRVIKAPSLPGSVAPKTTGEIICATILEMIGSEHLW